MARLIYVFKSSGLNDFPVEFKLDGIDNDITVYIEVSDAIWQIASLTGDLKTALTVSMTADIAAMDSVLSLKEENLHKVQNAYAVKNVWGLHELFKDSVQRAVDTYVTACSKLADRLRAETEQIEQL